MIEIREAMAEIERRRESELLVFAASSLELDLLPTLYDVLRGTGRSKRLDILFYCRGGIVNAARRIALMLESFTDHLAFIVPDRCESSGTITMLAAREVIAGPAAVFSPVDPLLETAGAQGDEMPNAVSAEDVRLFRAMAVAWFGLDEREAGLRAASVLCDNIFPTTLTSFYRSGLEVREICLELLSLHMPPEAAEAKERIVERLQFGHHSHSFAVTGDDLAALGLPVRRDAEVEGTAWEIARGLRGSIGSGARISQDEDWHDALLVSRRHALWRRRSRGGLAPVWEEVKTA